MPLLVNGPERRDCCAELGCALGGRPGYTRSQALVRQLVPEGCEIGSEYVSTFDAARGSAEEAG